MYKFYKNNPDMLYEEMAADEFANNLTEKGFWEAEV